MVREERLPVSRACKLISLPRSQYYYKSLKDDTVVIDALQKLSADHPTYGFRKLFAYLRRDGHDWNHKKVYRVYRQLKMNRRRKGKRRLPARIKQPLLQPSGANESWSMDFMSDSLVDGRKIRTLNIIDDCNREVTRLKVKTLNQNLKR
jgi:putative transposase